jgi:hypothetical protein
VTTNIPNPGGYISQLGNDLVALRVALDNLLRDGAYLNAVGGTAFLQAAPFNMSATDAQAWVNTIGAVTPANATVQAIQAFLTSAVPLTGGA